MYYINVPFSDREGEEAQRFAEYVLRSFFSLLSGGTSQLHPRHRGKKEGERAKVTSHLTVTAEEGRSDGF
jgi:hypothetical protein